MFQAEFSRLPQNRTYIEHEASQQRGRGGGVVGSLVNWLMFINRYKSLGFASLADGRVGRRKGGLWVGPFWVESIWDNFIVTHRHLLRCTPR